MQPFPFLSNQPLNIFSVISSKFVLCEKEREERREKREERREEKERREKKKEKGVFFLSLFWGDVSTTKSFFLFRFVKRERVPGSFLIRRERERMFFSSLTGKEEEEEKRRRKKRSVRVVQLNTLGKYFAEWICFPYAVDSSSLEREKGREKEGEREGRGGEREREGRGGEREREGEERERGERKEIDWGERFVSWEKFQPPKWSSSLSLLFLLLRKIIWFGEKRRVLLVLRF